MPSANLPKRENIRLSGYDYSQNGAYFVTICTRDKAHLLGNIAGITKGRPHIALSQFGQIAERYIRNIDAVYLSVSVPTYCVMPNHIHMIVLIDGCENGSPRAATPTVTLPKIINSLKLLATKEAGRPLWQRGYYEHIIRDEQDYLDIWKYIDNNAAVWAEDQYYQKLQSSGGDGTKE